MNKNYMVKQEVLERILISDDILISIQKNLLNLLKIIPELSEVIVKPVKRGEDSLWNSLLLSLNVSQKDFTSRLAILLYNIGSSLEIEDLSKNEFAMIMTKSILSRLNYDDETTNEVLYLVENYDNPITQKDIEDNFKLSEKLFFIQKYSCLPYDSKEYKRLNTYFEKTENSLKNQENKLGKVYELYLNRKEIKK